MIDRPDAVDPIRRGLHPERGREVVGRILSDLREAELVETGHDGIVLALAERLIEEGRHGTP